MHPAGRCHIRVAGGKPLCAECTLSCAHAEASAAAGSTSALFHASVISHEGSAGEGSLAPAPAGSMPLPVCAAACSTPVLVRRPSPAAVGSTPALIRASAISREEIAGEAPPQSDRGSRSSSAGGDEPPFEGWVEDDDGSPRVNDRAQAPGEDVGGEGADVENTESASLSSDGDDGSRESSFVPPPEAPIEGWVEERDGSPRVWDRAEVVDADDVGGEGADAESNESESLSSDGEDGSYESSFVDDDSNDPSFVDSSCSPGTVMPDGDVGSSAVAASAGARAVVPPEHFVMSRNKSLGDKRAWNRRQPWCDSKPRGMRSAVLRIVEEDMQCAWAVEAVFRAGRRRHHRVGTQEGISRWRRHSP